MKPSWPLRPPPSVADRQAAAGVRVELDGELHVALVLARAGDLDHAGALDQALELAVEHADARAGARRSRSGTPCPRCRSRSAWAGPRCRRCRAGPAPSRRRRRAGCPSRGTGSRRCRRRGRAGCRRSRRPPARSPGRRRRRPGCRTRTRGRPPGRRPPAPPRTGPPRLAHLGLGAREQLAGRLGVVDDRELGRAVGEVLADQDRVLVDLDEGDEDVGVGRGRGLADQALLGLARDLPRRSSRRRGSGRRRSRPPARPSRRGSARTARGRSSATTTRMPA